MSRYVRDDKEFRARVAKLADAGLTFPTAPAKLSEYPLHFDELVGDTKATLEAHGFSKKDYPANFNGVPAYVRTIEPLEIAPKGKLPELVAGLVWWSPFIAIGIVLLHVLLRGDH